MSGPGFGHNRGPSMEPGAGWRRHCWKAARRELLPRLPIEVLRRRLRRAAEVGLDYSTYATLRASGGEDIIAILFSTNALHLLKARDRLSRERAEKLKALHRCGRIVLASAPLQVADLRAGIEAETGLQLDGAAPAPTYPPSWSQMRQRTLAALAPARLPAGGVILVGETGFERDWSTAARLAGYVPAERYFAKE